MPELRIQPALSDIAIFRFNEKYKTDPTWMPADYVQLARLIKFRPKITQAEFDERYQNFLDSDNSFHQQQCGSLKYFATHYDSFINPILKGNGNVRHLGADW